MILVADSGSSKTDWILQLPQAQPLEFSTKGINPFYVNEKEIVKILQQENAVQPYISAVKEIHFFGAGCSSPDRREVVSNALSAVFKNAFANVDNDVVGSVYATCGSRKGLTCILGTGSNIAYFDGTDIHYGSHGVGYILGDEGSGTYFGKQLLTGFLYDTMPADLKRAFKKQFPADLEKETVISKVYQKSGANVYLASFARFMSTHKQHEYIQQILTAGFKEFIETHIHCFSSYAALTCHFIGSIAYYFSDVLEKVCKENNIQTGKILQRPIHHLYQYILEKEVVSGH